MIRPLIHWLLCLMVLVGSTCTVVQHTHDRGQAPHAHGFGLSINTTAEFLAPPISATHHRHLVVCGIEVFVPDAPSDDVTHSDATVQVEVGLRVDPLSESSTQIDSVSELPTTLCLFAYESAPSVHRNLRSESLRPTPLCDQANHARTGVSTT